MKTLLKSLLPLVLLLVVSSCKKDDSNAATIVKKWKLIKVTYKDVNTQTGHTYTVSGTPYLDFSSDHHFVSTLHTTLEGSVPFSVLFTTTDFASGPYSLSSDNSAVTFTFIGATETLTIEKLTNSELTLEFDKNGPNDQTFYFKN